MKTYCANIWELITDCIMRFANVSPLFVFFLFVGERKIKMFLILGTYILSTVFAQCTCHWKVVHLLVSVILFNKLNDHYTSRKVASVHQSLTHYTNNYTPCENLGVKCHTGYIELMTSSILKPLFY